MFKLLKRIVKTLKSPNSVTPSSLFIFAILLTFLLIPGTVSAGTTNLDGYTKDESGSTLSGVNVTVKSFIQDPNPHIEEVSNISNKSGYFNITGVPDNATMYIIWMEKRNGSMAEYG